MRSIAPAFTRGSYSVHTLWENRTFKGYAVYRVGQDKPLVVYSRFGLAVRAILDLLAIGA